MRKIWVIFIVIILALGIFVLKNRNKTVVNSDIKTYRNTTLGISFVYPKILTISSDNEAITIHHEVPFIHHDYCDFKGEITTSIPTLTDFNVDFYLVDKNLVNTMKSESPYIPSENFVDNQIIPSPGFIDTYKIGNLNGFKIFEGAEGCGQTTYYFPISNEKTLVAKEELVTVFTGAIDTENESRALAVPGVINKDKSTEIFESIMKTLQVQ